MKKRACYYADGMDKKNDPEQDKAFKSTD